MSAATTAGRAPLRARPWWPWLRRGATTLFLLVVAVLLAHQARKIEWQEVGQALQALPVPVLLGALALAATSHLVYSSYDLLGRRMTGHTLGTGTVMGVTFISYAFNLNFGALVGGVAFRLRLYSRLGLAGEQIARVLGFSMLTNWSGYLLAAGVAFLFWPPALPPEWKLDGQGLRILGAILLALAGAYLLLCAWGHGKRVQLRDRAFELPGVRMALLQLALSCLNWCVIASIVWVLLQNAVSYPLVLAVLLVSAVAAVLTHVPAGLGVLEAVFLALLGHQVPAVQLLAALLAYRAVYYLLPLLLALLGYGLTELRARRLAAAAALRSAGPGAAR